MQCKPDQGNFKQLFGHPGWNKGNIIGKTWLVVRCSFGPWSCRYWPFYSQVSWTWFANLAGMVDPFPLCYVNYWDHSFASRKTQGPFYSQVFWTWFTNLAGLVDPFPLCSLNYWYHSFASVNFIRSHLLYSQQGDQDFQLHQLATLFITDISMFARFIPPLVHIYRILLGVRDSQT